MLQNQNNIAQTYTDLNSLQGIRTLGKTDKNAALMETAKQFESMFVNLVMESMRKASAVFEEDSLLHSSEMDFYQNMYDQQMALTLANGKGLGLAPVIFQQLKQAYGEDGERPELNQSALFDRQAAHVKPLHEQVIAPTVDAVEQLRPQRHIQPLHSEKVTTPTPTPPTAVSVSSAQGEGEKGQQFATAEEFVAALYPSAEQIGTELGVDPRAIVAQAALETGWGRYMISDKQGQNSFNFFGIKADQRWEGEQVNVTTHEFMDGRLLKQQANFRSYPSLEEGLRDYASFLKSSERYQPALGNNLSGDHYGYALQQAGYATDPNYGAKIKRIASGDTLTSALLQHQQGK